MAGFGLLQCPAHLLQFTEGPTNRVRPRWAETCRRVRSGPAPSASKRSAVFHAFDLGFPQGLELKVASRELVGLLGDENGAGRS